MAKTILTLSLLLMSAALIAQRGIVEGNLFDKDGMPLPGISVLVKDSPQATISDLNGYYSIECNVGDILVFTFIGMQTQEKVVRVNMFKQITGKSSEMPKPVQQIPVNLIQTAAYAELTNKNITDEGKPVDMNSSPLRWKYHRNPYNNPFFATYSYSDILFKDSVFEFVFSPPPLNYTIQFNSSIHVSEVMNLPELQSEYAQGSPYSGNNTWFGPETNELFAWGPKIENMVFDDSDYPYDLNGRLIPKNLTNKNPAKQYDPYAIFQKGLIYDHALKLHTKRNDRTWEFSYTNRVEKELIETIRSTANTLELDFEQKKGRLNWNARLNYILTKNSMPNSNALHTKMMAAIMLTPPSFDNTQGYLFPDGQQRSSSPGFKNNPYFLLHLTGNELNRRLFNGHASLAINLDQTDLGILLKYGNNYSDEKLNIHQNSIGFANAYAQNEEIQTSDFYLKVYAKNNSIRNLVLNTGAIFITEKLEFKRQIESTEPVLVFTDRTSLNWIQNLIYNPDLSGDLEISLKNNVYLTSEKQKWFLPTLAMAYNFAHLIGYGTFQLLNLSADFTKSVAELPLYLQDMSHSTLLIDFPAMNGFLENNELFYTKNLDLETRQSMNIGLQSGMNIEVIYLDLGFNFSAVKSRNSIFPVLSGEIYELANVADIRNNTWEINLKVSNKTYHRFHWKSSLIFSKSNPMVDKLYGNRDRLPIAGFQSISKNLVENQPVGVLIGSAYKRNEHGQLLIGSDGFPLVDEMLKIIANPNPDFYLAMENKFSLKGNFEFSFLIDYQKGGEIWNGTKNILDYYGMSGKSATERNITQYIFDGINESGEPNTLPVDFANPANGLEGNRWFRYGPGGVAEDAIEDGSWFRFKEIALTYKKNLNRAHIRELRIKLFINNLWIFSGYSGSSPISGFNNYIQGQGLDYFNMPDKREIGMSINLKF